MNIMMSASKLDRAPAILFPVNFVKLAKEGRVNTQVYIDECLRTCRALRGFGSLVHSMAPPAKVSL